jgi:hypothetical protein
MHRLRGLAPRDDPNLLPCLSSLSEDPDMRTMLSALACACAMPALTAQAFTITSGNVTYTNVISNTVPGSTSSVFDVNTCTSDHLWDNHWCFAVNNGAGRVFDDVGNGSYSQTPSPGTMLQTIGNAAALGQIDATILDTVTSTGPQSGELLSLLTVTNRTANTITVKIYHFTDLDVNATNAPDYSLPGSGPQRFVIGDDQPCGGCATFSAVTPAGRFQCGDWTSAGGPPGVNITAGADLANTGLPFALPNDDWCGAFQWSRTLAPGASDAFQISIAVTSRGMTGTNSTTGIAVGGTGGPPTLLGATAARVGRSFRLNVANGGAAANATILLGIDAAPMQAPIFGLHVMTPISGILAAIDVPLTAGAGSLSFAIPCEVGSLGVPLCTQVFVLDPTSPALLPLAHSLLLLSTVGD